MRRVHEFKIRMNVDEWRAFENILNKVPMLSRESVARTLILSGSIHENPPAEYGEILRELHRIGLNMNQIAKKANTFGFVDKVKLNEALNDIEQMKVSFRKLFS